MSQVRDAGQGGGQGKNLKVTNIVESIDVGVPIDVAYNQWTQFTDCGGPRAGGRGLSCGTSSGT